MFYLSYLAIIARTYILDRDLFRPSRRLLATQLRSLLDKNNVQVQ